MSDQLDLSVFAAALRADLEAQVASAAGEGDVAASVARAHELGPQQVTAQFVAETAALAPVVPLAAAEDGETLLPFAAAYRTEVTRRVRERSYTSIPPLTGSLPAVPVGERPIWPWFLGAAAAICLVVGGSFMATRGTAQSRALEQAAARTAVQPGPQFAGPGGGDLSTAPTQQAVDMTGGASTSATGPSESVGADKPSARRELNDELETLDRKARAAWRAGKVAQAEGYLRELVKIGGRHSKVELAFGDLFTIAQQRRDRPASTRYWKQYLRRFPSGRFATDARAGLCRGGGQGARGCWESYLRKHPDGPHRSEAEAALEGP